MTTGEDGVLLWIVAVIMLFVMAFLLIRLMKDSRSEGLSGSMSEQERKTVRSREQMPGPSSTTERQLYISPEMMKHGLIDPGISKEERNVLVHMNREKKSYDQKPDAADDVVVIYRHTDIRELWICPYCEAENDLKRPVCQVCLKSWA